MFVPDMPDYKTAYNDNLLRYDWHISDTEWAIIDSKIK